MERRPIPFPYLGFRLPWRNEVHLAGYSRQTHLYCDQCEVEFPSAENPGVVAIIPDGQMSKEARLFIKAVWDIHITRYGGHQPYLRQYYAVKEKNE